MDDNRLYGRPRGNALDAQANRNIALDACLSEFIDNAFDAKASCVVLEWDGVGRSRIFRVSDDGHGCSDMSQFYSSGATSGAAHRVGRYGVGAKDAALVMGKLRSEMRVRSTKDGVTYSVNVNWLYMHDNDWLLAEIPTSAPALEGVKGTSIEVSPLDPSARYSPTGARLAELRDLLSFRYASALRQGSSILIRGPGESAASPLYAWDLPRFERGLSIETTITVRDKTAHVVCGVVAKGQLNPYPGLSYHYLYRAVLYKSANGCGKHVTTRIAGRVVLDDKWRLTTNKDNIQGADELYAEIERACRTVLEAGDRAASEISSSAFSTKVETMINGPSSGEEDDGEEKTARVSTGDDRGGRNEKGGARNGGTRRGNEVSRPTKRKRARAAYRLAWDRLGSADQIGSVLGTTITLNIQNPAVALARDEDNALATAAMALALVAFDENTKPANERQPQFRAMELSDVKEAFQRTLGKLTMHVGIDGKEVLGGKKRPHLKAVR